MSDNMNIVEAKNLTHSYEFEGRKSKSLDNLSMQIEKGEFVAILGHNGCGKSTLARHLNALIKVQQGELKVAGLDASNNVNIWNIRRTCGMVFQNPDNQFVSSIVEEDIAFGLRNFGVPRKEHAKRISEALSAVGMEGYEKHSPWLLSGGQKQRIAIAGVLAVDPDIMIFDEATAMLDPEGRCEVLDVISRLHKQGRTIIMISHYIEEAIYADRVILVHDGQVLGQGEPREVFKDLELLKRTGLTPPLAVGAYYDLKEEGINLQECPLTNEELVEALCQLN